MILPNKLNITDQAALDRAEEEISKRKAKRLFDSGDIRKVEVGIYTGLAFIHRYLFEDIYPFAGELREVNMSKGNFRFASVMFLKPSLEHIDRMPQRHRCQLLLRGIHHLQNGRAVKGGGWIS